MLSPKTRYDEIRMTFALKRLLDFAITLTLFLGIQPFLTASPFFRWWLPLVFFGLFFGQWALAQTILDESFSHYLLRKLKAPIAAALGILLTSIGIATFILRIQASPLTQPIPRVEMPAQFAAPEESVLAFFYALVALPDAYEGQPVFYQIPYEKGPPTRFISRVIARLKMPEIKLVIEGPRTPTENGMPIVKSRIAKCLGFAGGGTTYAGECAKIREIIFERHLADLKEQKLEPHRVQWVQVLESRLDPVLQTQGFLISAVRPGRTQLRFTAITANDLHQSFIFETTQDLAAAEATFLPWISKMRLSPDLSSGQSWANASIAQVQLSPELSLQSLAQIQAKLTAKLTVDAKTYDTYFHLGGIASLLQQKALQHKADTADWKAVPKNLLEAMVQYARDVSPEDPRNVQLQGLLSKLK